MIVKYETQTELYKKVTKNIRNKEIICLKCVKKHPAVIAFSTMGELSC